MSRPAFRDLAYADRLVASLSEYFADHLPPQLGSEAYSHIKRRLRSEGFLDNSDAEDVFSTALTNALRYLRQHGGGEIRQPRAWFHALCRRACVDFLKDSAVRATYTLSSVIDGETELSGDTTLSDERAQVMIHRAIEQLRPRYQQFIILDLVECQPSATIQVTMNLPSNGAYRKLKHESFMALREAIRRLIDKG
jgi:DNA-directed RNA polymerase specialized sigma24 family protein